MQTLYGDRDDAYDTGGYSGCFRSMCTMAKYEVANSGRDLRSYTRTDGRFVLEIEDRGISEELQSDEQGADRRFSFTAACAISSIQSI